MECIEELSLIAKIPMPKIYIIDDPSPNAFAAGNSPETASVAATTGIFEVEPRRIRGRYGSRSFTYPKL